MIFHSLLGRGGIGQDRFTGILLLFYSWQDLVSFIVGDFEQLERQHSAFFSWPAASKKSEPSYGYSTNAPFQYNCSAASPITNTWLEFTYICSLRQTYRLLFVTGILNVTCLVEQNCFANRSQISMRNDVCFMTNWKVLIFYIPKCRGKKSFLLHREACFKDSNWK